ncbi:Uncharacterised protein [Mycolicibacterium aurum]|uniref:Uncharacterized protein n=1 Tax=Mycolicibacterium aurum TaxID=1791 RepID=A0A3S5EK00_MYCAU|nr:hypothetical protein [Mycolicibacterium aurum]VEG58367.1 Uncharacterised protein [Mycolicibacterium aurum]
MRPTEPAAGAESSLLLAAYRNCESLPLVGGLFTRGRREAQAVLSVVVAAVISELDMTAIVRDRLPAEAIEAVIARIDLVALANQVIDGVELRAIIREATSLATTEVMHPAEARSLVERMRTRRQRS